MSVSAAPVLMLIFNRPDLTARIFESVRAARPAKLYLACDGPRSLAELQLVKDCQRVVSEVDWPCEVFTLYRPRNLGCKVAVSEAITWFFEREEAGIILEDDVLPVPEFFEFMNKALVEYRDKLWVGAVSGISLTDEVDQSGQVLCRSSAFPMIWGWGTWRRVWEKYRVELRANCGTNSDPVLTDFRLTSSVFVQNWTRIFDDLKSGAVNTWDYQLCYLFMKENLRCVLPTVPLVDNIGFDSRATHTKGLRPNWLIKPSQQSEARFNFKVTRRDDLMDELILDRVFGVNRVSKIKHFIKNVLRLGAL